MDNKIAIYNFLTGIKKSKSSEQPTFDEIYARAFQLAWKDMATHTLRLMDDGKKLFDGYSNRAYKNRDTLAECMRNAIWNTSKGNGIFNLLKSDSTFNAIHKSLCEYIVTDMPKLEIESLDPTGKSKTYKISCIYTHAKMKKTTFTYGQAQKLVNMIVKYLYAYSQLYDISLDSSKLNDLMSETKRFHAPLDSYVLKKIEYSGVPWSQINDYENTYENIQKAIRENFGNDPFLWELENWPFL